MDDKSIFKQGSTTYYWSAKFFPKTVRDDVFKLYSFVRVVDDYVDSTEPDMKSFMYIVEKWAVLKKSLAQAEKHHGKTINDRVLRNIAYVVHHHNCDPEWVDAFLRSMQMDLDKKVYRTLDDTLEYVYGSAEVIGLLMAKVIGLPDESLHYARMQGRAMQFINFIRDIEEDNALGRIYFPDEDFTRFGIKSLDKSSILNKQIEFGKFIQFQVARYSGWQDEADKGFKYIPKRSRIAIRTAVDMYNWTAHSIAEQPMLVFHGKLKPRKSRIIQAGILRTING